MSFDLSRIRFDHRKDFLGVIMQQGRVQLDADWNEWVAQIARRIQAGALDGFGGSAVPRVTPDGFRIEAAGGGLTIGPGRIYVDGLLAENHGGTPDAWDARLANLAGTTPLDYAAQPYYPDPQPLPAGGPHLVYVDVWQRDVTAIEDPQALLEPALGVDTTGRRQTVWQVRVLADVGAIDCSTPDDEIPNWLRTIAPSAGRLSTDTGVPDFEPDPCQLPPAAGYRGRENQLYRVEVHTGGPVGTATFKWSRDNATVASRVSHIDAAGTRITVESVGRDDVLAFHDGDWVEITDDWREFAGLPGELRRIRPAGGVDRNARTLAFDDALPGADFPTDAQQATEPARNTRVRRWDQAGPIRDEDGTEIGNVDTGGTGEIGIPPAGTRLFLEHGILVEFDLASTGGEFHSGDYWVFAARSATADIERLALAPPLGVHHHYARLAVVDFPDDETDCRRLWPPEVQGAGCACTVCVDADAHNAGSATIQHAIDAIKDIGGTICLGVGSFRLDRPLTIQGARSLTLRGQGRASVLEAPQGAAIVIDGGSGVALERFSAVGIVTEATAVAVIDASDVTDLKIARVDVVGGPPGNAVVTAIGLSGVLMRADITECGLAADRGVALQPDKAHNWLLSAELRIARNIVLGLRNGVDLGGNCLHYGNTRIADNLILAGAGAAVVATGATLPATAVAIADNTIHCRGDGIHCGVDRATVSGNRVAGLVGNGADAIVLTDGLLPEGEGKVDICDNALGPIEGNGIRIARALDVATVRDNRIEAIGLAALVMEKNGSANALQVRANHCRQLGLALANSEAAYAALQLVRVERGEVCGNHIVEIARGAVATPAIAALRGIALGKLMIDGNTFDDVGPDRSSGETAAIRLPTPFDQVQVDDNRIERIRAATQTLSLAIWRAIDIGPEPRRFVAGLAPVALVAAGELAFVLTETLAIRLPARRAAASLRGNQLRALLSDVELVRSAGTDHCLFADNHCEAQGEAGRDPRIADLASRTVTASGNRMIAAGDRQTLVLRPGQKLAIVTANTSTGGIDVQGGSPLPNDILFSNLIGS